MLSPELYGLLVELKGFRHVVRHRSFDGPQWKGEDLARRPGYTAAIERIREARTFLNLPDGVTVSVSELPCRDPGCPDVETVVAILAAGSKPRIARFHKPIPEIEQDELDEGLSGLAYPGC